jgi:hypothetical protein
MSKGEKVKSKNCKDCGTKVQIAPQHKGPVWCDECAWEWMQNGARRSISGRDLDSAQEFQFRNEIETSDV